MNSLHWEIHKIHFSRSLHYASWIQLNLNLHLTLSKTQLIIVNYFLINYNLWTTQNGRNNPMTAGLSCRPNISEIRAKVPSVLNEIAKRFVCCNLYEAIVLQRELSTVCLYILFRRTEFYSFGNRLGVGVVDKLLLLWCWRNVYFNHCKTGI